MKRILMVAQDAERWGPARLPEPLAKAGLEVAVLCAPENALHHSAFVARRFPLGELKSWKSFGATLSKTLADWNPDLIIPCDELVVAMLHYLLKRPAVASRFFNTHQNAVLQRSMGKLESLDAMMLKYDTRLLAESVGVPCPMSQKVNSPDAAQRAAGQIGYPVFLKASFSWAGTGSIACNTAAEVSAAYERLSAKTPVFKQLLKHALARNWYPHEITIEVQKAIPGDAVMYSVAALDGQVLGGLFAYRTSRLGSTGPSTSVEVGGDPAYRRLAEKMIAAFGASGFLAFDFMRSAETGEVFLLECNPRPNQICHLGEQVGRDLCQALADGLNGQPLALAEARAHKTIPLFPQAWIENESGSLRICSELDVPRNDPILFRFMLQRGQGKGCSPTALCRALEAQGGMPAHYPFG